MSSNLITDAIAASDAAEEESRMDGDIPTYCRDFSIAALAVDFKDLIEYEGEAKALEEINSIWKGLTGKTLTQT